MMQQIVIIKSCTLKYTQKPSWNNTIWQS